MIGFEIRTNLAVLILINNKYQYSHLMLNVIFFSSNAFNQSAASSFVWFYFRSIWCDL